jgi:hypothetical protein
MKVIEAERAESMPWGERASSEVVSQPESPFTRMMPGHETANFGDEASSIDRPGTCKAIRVVIAVDPSDSAEEGLSASSIECVDMKDVGEGRLTPGKHPTELASVFLNMVENPFKNRPRPMHRKHPHIQGVIGERVSLPATGTVCLGGFS